MNTRYMRQLDLRTGKIKLITRREEFPDISIYAYFNSINIMNETADEYGVVYLPTDNVLGDLKELEEK